MTISKAQAAATNKYNKANYDNLSIRIPKGCKEVLKELADANKMSLAAMVMWSITQAYTDHMEKDMPAELRDKMDDVIMATRNQINTADTQYQR